ncbi:MAG: hypothetical protein JW942_01360 [Opitutales bacterium]|nr:hypothetical protein [Opitutales bacterium]
MYHPLPVNGAPECHGFNGQSKRKAIVQAILDGVGIGACVETGTFRGDTAEWLVLRHRRVFSVELNPELRPHLEARFADSSGVHLFFGDSRRFLAQLLENPRCPLQGVFFYLDAHWFADLPLREELAFIVSNWRRSVIMVDDFEVPGDSGYGYDVYPGIGALNQEYLRTRSGPALHWFWPSEPSSSEDGARRGCAVIAWEEGVAKRLAALPQLRS